MATRTIPLDENDYFYATYDRTKDATIGCRPMIVNVGIMPMRSNNVGMGIQAKRCMRGVDVMFLAEAVATRQAIAPASDGQPLPGTLAVTPEIKADRLVNIRVCMAQQWRLWAILSNVDYGNFTSVNFGTNTQSTASLLSRLKTEIDFSNGTGTMTPVPQFTELRMDEMQNLFSDIGKMQCCVVPLVGATYVIDGGGSASNHLASFSSVVINKYGIQDINGPFYARSVTVRHAFPPAAAGSKVMLFAYSGGYSWKARDYPTDQENGENAFCLVPTDGAWHEISSDGTLTAVIDGQTMLGNVVNACSFNEPFPEVPEDDDPESTKNRQASWRYYLMSSNNIQPQNRATFFALFDLYHTEIGHLV